MGVTAQMRQVKGVATTRQDAVKNALYEAVSQVQGVLVTTGIADSAVGVGVIESTHEAVNKTIEMEGISLRAQHNITLTMAEGLVKSYEVVDEKKTDDGKVEVTVNVWVYDYQSPLANTRFSLAVSPFEAEPARCVFGDIMVSGDEVSRQFSQRLVTLLRDSHRLICLTGITTRRFGMKWTFSGPGIPDWRKKAGSNNCKGPITC